MPDMDEVKGKAREAIGGMQEKTGEATGDKDTEVEGHSNKIEGKAEGMFGKLKEAAGDAVKSVEDRFHHKD